MSQNTETGRLRPHPDERFAGDSHFFDLNKALERLRQEAHEAQSGHRQMTLFHRAPTTQVLFAFEANGELADHAANGLVTILVLEGEIAVEAAGQTHQLGAAMMLVLAPGVRHSLRAAQPSAMLLTVQLERDR